MEKPFQKTNMTWLLVASFSTGSNDRNQCLKECIAIFLLEVSLPTIATLYLPKIAFERHALMGPDREAALKFFSVTQLKNMKILLLLLALRWFLREQMFYSLTFLTLNA